jgi:aconitate hydratase
VVEVIGLADHVAQGGKGSVTVRAVPENGPAPIEVEVRVRLDTPQEVQYYRHGGILHYVLRQLLRPR